MSEVRWNQERWDRAKASNKAQRTRQVALLIGTLQEAVDRLLDAAQARNLLLPKDASIVPVLRTLDARSLQEEAFAKYVVNHALRRSVELLQNAAGTLENVRGHHLQTALVEENRSIRRLTLLLQQAYA